MNIFTIVICYLTTQCILLLKLLTDWLLFSVLYASENVNNSSEKSSQSKIEDDSMRHTPVKGNFTLKYNNKILGIMTWIKLRVK